MLPNPTPYYWEPNTFSLSTLTSNIASLLKEARRVDPLTSEGDQISQLLDFYNRSTEKTEKPPNGSIKTEISATTPADSIAHLRAGVELCDRYLDEVDIGMVFQVVRVHIQEVLAILNEKSSLDELAGSGLGNGGQKSTITISDIDSASVDEKHHLLAQIYCAAIRNSVIHTVYKQRSQYSPKTSAEMADSETSVKRDINQIWCTLIFRMLYWLQLHNFHKKDIQIDKGDAYDSRIPVYIL